MIGRLERTTVVGTGAGLAAGLVLGAVLAWAWLDIRPETAQLRELLEATPAYAVATDSGESFVMSTGPISDGVEGLFVLDAVTGQLTCWVINPRTAQLGALFQHNVINDLGVDPGGRQPQYLMVTGVANFRPTGQQVRPSDCLLYVADAHTGRFAAYTVPWNRNLAVGNVVQTGALRLMFVQNARDPTAIRD